MDYRSFVRRLLAAHSLIGVGLGAMLFVVCLTGAISTLASEFRLFEQPAAPVVNTAKPEAYEALMRYAFEPSRQSGNAIVILGPTDQTPRLELRNAGVPDGYADVGGTIIVPARTPWTDFVTELHENLHLPGNWGSAIIGLAGVALLGSLISGVAAHAKIWRDLFRLRLRGSARKREADLHNRIGVWGIPPFFVIALTGAYLALAHILVPVIEPLVPTQAAASPVATPRVPSDEGPIGVPAVADLIRAVERDHAPAKVSFVMLTAPGTPDQILHIDTDLPRKLASGESYRFDAYGNPLGPVGYADGPVGLQMQVAMFPLHVGNFAGAVMRWLYFAIGLALCFLVASGMRIWLLRMQQQGLSVAARWRVWSAFLWSQPLALAAAWFGPFAGLSPLLLYLMASLCGAGLSCFPIKLRTIRQTLALTTSASLGAVLVLVTAEQGHAPIAQPAAWLVLATALGFAATTLRLPVTSMKADAVILGKPT
ncbi:PepSY-associated TM helix domain-containing protein [Oscillatoria laete-virens NRMC-F 0139]|nr:PepSY-associated TM helix domain-containing protein [Oscillatoria laete-virens]MDL5054813.1 PepSY-associated TM helix domain-containing protein [Oscillatoria laete-virens NRMC-F 0139]